MKHNIVKIVIFALIISGLIYSGLNYIFLNQKGPKSKAAGETINLTFSPTSFSGIAVNQDIIVNVMAKPSLDTLLRGYKTKINFDKTKLAFKSISYLVGLVSNGLGDTTSQAVTINSLGLIKVIGELQSDTGYLLPLASSSAMVNLTFTVLSTSPTSISYSDSSFFSINPDKSLFSGWTFATSSLSINGVVDTPTPTSTPIPPTPTMTPTSTPTLTPIPIITLTPTPDVSTCVCGTNDLCSDTCTFDKFVDVNYSSPFKCSQDPNAMVSIPTADEKTGWCRSTLRTKGDVDGNGKFERTDYYYYVSAINGGKIPASITTDTVKTYVDADVDGDGAISTLDRSIIMRSQP